MKLRTHVTRALSSSYASLTTPRTSPRILRGASLGLLGSLFLLSADSSHAYRPTHSRHIAVHRRSPAAQDVQSAGVVNGMVLAPGTNLAAAMGPVNPADALAAQASQPAASPRYELRLHHLHTGEDIDIVYRIGNQYVPSAIARLNYFLRDHRTQDVSHYDPREFDLLHTIVASLGRPGNVIDIVCGYRTPWSNNYLRTRAATTGVARNSQHVQAKAIDIRIPGVTTSHLRDVALSLRGGGVGYYPVSEFVHVDVGPVRQWSFGGRGE